VAATLEGLFTQLLSDYDQKPEATRMTAAGHALRVEIYPYVPYIQYLLRRLHRPFRSL